MVDVGLFVVFETFLFGKEDGVVEVGGVFGCVFALVTALVVAGVEELGGVHEGFFVGFAHGVEAEVVSEFLVLLGFLGVVVVGDFFVVDVNFHPVCSVDVGVPAVFDT